MRLIFRTIFKEKIAWIIKAILIYALIVICLGILWEILNFLNDVRIGFFTCLRGLYILKNEANIMERILFVIGCMLNSLGVSILVSSVITTPKLIHINEYCIFEEKCESKPAFVFRYWIFLKDKEYLYDLNIKVTLIDEKELIQEDGVNKVKGLWNSEDSKNCQIYNLQKARGKRYLRIDGEDAINIQNIIEKYMMCNDKELSNLYFNVSILATDKNGNRYDQFVNFKLSKQLLVKHQFAPCDSFEYGYKYVKEKNCLPDDFQFYNIGNYFLFYKTDIDFNNIFVNKIWGDKSDEDKLIISKKYEVIKSDEIFKINSFKLFMNKIMYKLFDGRKKVDFKSIKKSRKDLYGRKKENKI